MTLRAPVPEARHRRVDPDIVAVLSRAHADGDALQLAGDLDRALYARVDAVIRAAGGRWDRRRRAHVFAEREAVAAIEPILVAGVLTLPPDLGWFPTPAPLAAALVGYSGARRGSRVLEPSAGEGAIVRALLDVGAEVEAMEIDPGRALALALLEGPATPLRTFRGDFLERFAEPVFDAVVMNPPFAPRSTDAHHVRHAFGFLRPGGRLVAAMSAGLLFRRERVSVELRDLVHRLGGAIEPLPRGSFAASGTDVRTVLVTARKPKGNAHG